MFQRRDMAAVGDDADFRLLYGSSQYAGMMGAFGRRRAKTEGYDSETEFFEWKWDDDERTWYCRLPDTVREALTLEELI